MNGYSTGKACVRIVPAVQDFTASADFAYDKAAGQPCKNLQGDFRCGIHDKLLRSGFKGCAAFDCYGAGQQVTQQIFRGGDWQSQPEIAQRMFRALSVMVELHEMLWYLTEAMEMAGTAPLRHELERKFVEIKAMTELERERNAATGNRSTKNHRQPAERPES